MRACSSVLGALAIMIGALPAAADDAPAITPATVRALLRPRADEALALAPAPRPLPTPAQVGSAEPNLAISPEGDVWLSWVEPGAKGGSALRAAKLIDGGWSKAVTIAAGDSLLGNWANFPSLLAVGSSRLVAHWPWQNSESRHNSDVRVSQSSDGGVTWSAPQVPHRDATATEHGFVSMVGEAGGTRLVWLDGRNMAAEGARAASAGHAGDEEPEGDTMLRTAWLGPDSRLGDDTMLDARVCDCCQTSAARIAGGFLIVYRDRDSSEVRDISAIRFDKDGWSAPYAVWPDGWKVPGCPVNGPAVDAIQNLVAVAWYTAAGDSARVLATVSIDGGRTFREPTPVDGGSPLGRVSIAALEDGSAVVVWLEGTRADARVMARWVRASGAFGPAVEWARSNGARNAGFPRVLRAGNSLVVAWTEGGKQPGIRTALVAAPTR